MTLKSDANLEQDLDSPDRVSQLSGIIREKPALREFYSTVYKIFSQTLMRCPADGIALELGSGASFAKDLIPELTTSDIIGYEGVDQIVDAQEMIFEDKSLRGIFMMNVLHHIANPEKFFREAQRCLKSGGRILIYDQYPGLIARPILRFFHHEHFDDKVESWQFDSSGPLSSANGAQAWNIFFRDRRIFEQKFDQLNIDQVTFHSPLLYWMSGGLRSWTFAPEALVPFILFVDAVLLKLSFRFASFVAIEISRKECP